MICLSPKCQFSPAGLSLIQPLLEPFEHNLSQSSPIKSLFQPTMGPISAPGCKSALGNWTVLALIKGAKLDSKIGLYFSHRNGLIFRAKTDLFYLQCTFDNIMGGIGGRGCIQIIHLPL